MSLSHPYIFIYVDGVWCTIQSSGMAKCRYWEYSFSWCKMMGNMNHWPSAQVNTINVHHNGDLYVCVFRVLSPGKTCECIWPYSTFHWYKTKFHQSSTPAWFLVEYHWVLRGCSYFLAKVEYFLPYPVSLQLCSFVCWKVYSLICMWALSQNSLIICSLCCDTLDIYFGSSTRPSWEYFALISSVWVLTLLSHNSWNFYFPSLFLTLISLPIPSI